ncbi:SigE family RNA polymerase sigma factor [Actinomadura verrucosospora]|uniref:ECF subfamily RNA polymerase sigma-24 subunit n=1 Tax=Actinomadura verrucosospora TaxID=46165 RepID=A0A7D4A4H3_ACTVE|nr:SigE family RNA polymerase sigma factor [Actinomadura verrucosospora]QKG20327.1 ECF subfamily RNA polymerase sigma-24 subunit [Actinomadura verrucosospora]
MPERPDYAAYVTERSPRLLRTAYLLCRDWAQAEDLLQTALVKAWRAWRRVGDNPDPYVYRILVNTHASWAKRRWRGERPTERPPDGPDPADGIGAAEDKAVLWAALGRLPQRQRATVVLRFFEDLSEPQVAAILGCSVGTVKSQTSKALAKLRIDPGVLAAAPQGGE